MELNRRDLVLVMKALDCYYNTLADEKTGGNSLELEAIYVKMAACSRLSEEIHTELLKF